MKTGWVSQIKQSKPVKKIQKKVLDLCIAGTNLRQRALCKYLLKAHSVTQMKDCSNLGTASTRANSGVGEPCSCPRACLWQRVLLCIFHGAHSPRESLVGKWRSLVGKWRYASCSALGMGSSLVCTDSCCCWGEAQVAASPSWKETVLRLCEIWFCWSRKPLKKP